MNGNMQYNMNNFNNNNNSNNNQSQKDNKTVLYILIVIIIIIITIIIAIRILATTKSFDDNNSSQNQTQNNNQTQYDNTEYDETGTFLMPIEDMFTIAGRGTAVTGRIERGSVKLGDTIQIMGLNYDIKTTKVNDIEMYRKSVDYAKAGDNVSIFLDGISRSEVQRGQVLALPNSISNYTKFNAEIYILKEEEGGLNNPFYINYGSQFFFRTVVIVGTIELPEEIKVVNPGDTITANIELASPIPMEVGTKFSVREGGRTIGKGTVKSIDQAQ